MTGSLFLSQIAALRDHLLAVHLPKGAVSFATSLDLRCDPICLKSILSELNDH